jgi:hypothetical protein
MDKVVAVRDVWRSVVGDISDPHSSTQHSGETVDNSCAVMAWVAVQCVQQAECSQGVSKKAFQVDEFAQHISEQLGKADSVIRRLELENHQLKTRLTECNRLLTLSGREYSKTKCLNERLSMINEDYRSQLG